MADAYTLKKLSDVKDSAPAFGHGELQEARFAGKDLGAADTGVVLSGSGRAKLEDGSSSSRSQLL